MEEILLQRNHKLDALMRQIEGHIRHVDQQAQYVKEPKLKLKIKTESNTTKCRCSSQVPGDDVNDDTGIKDTPSTSSDDYINPEQTDHKTQPFEEESDKSSDKEQSAARHPVQPEEENDERDENDPSGMQNEHTVCRVKKTPNRGKRLQHRKQSPIIVDTNRCLEEVSNIQQKKRKSSVVVSEDDAKYDHPAKKIRTSRRLEEKRLAKARKPKTD
jgi:hypothetical protein